ncbi:hypothetical protein AAIR98_001451 [Elusimicrobium simillimum]|uniref:hypothetical protein n=1 Tax=Elusimicrobium simillimum TaxID=3143438 RepID=UPI003C6F6F9C
MRKEEKMTVRPGLEKDYAEYVAKNQDWYGNHVIVRAAAAGKALDAGKSCEDAEDEIGVGGTSGYQAGAIAATIKYFHPRGEDFRKFWNKKCGGTGKEKGTINPAIITLKGK